MANPKHFILTDDGFIFKGITYCDDQISHIFFQRAHTTVRMNGLLKTGETDTVSLEIELKNNLKILVSSEGGFAPQRLVFKNKDVELKSITDWYVFIANRTFRRRLDFYVSQVDNNGYFIYDNCRFIPPNKIIFRDNEFFLPDTRLLKSYGVIELEKKKMGIMDKIKLEGSYWFSKPAQFNTEVDSDVFFVLLEEYFGLRWAD